MIAAVSLPACGGEDEGSTIPRVSVVETQRPEIAFFRTSGSAVYDLAIADGRGKNLRALSGESVAGTVVPNLFTGISWSPEGRRIAFAGGTGEQFAFDHPSDIYSIAPDGSDLERITKLDNAYEPLWSPDGKTIVFSRVDFRRGQPLRGELWSIRPDGSKLTQLTEAEPWHVDEADSFTPDGSRIAFTRTEIDRKSFAFSPSIHLVNLDGSDEEELIERASGPAFSPDGERIAFTSDRDENGELSYGDRTFFANELYVADADGGDAERLTETEELNEAQPSWLRDGSRLAYQRGEEFGNAEAMSILEINADGSCVHEILAGSGEGPWYASPAWRPSRPRKDGGALSC